jgi:hypothetical protein
MVLSKPHLLLAPDGRATEYKFTSASVAMAFLQVLNQRFKSITTDCSPLITIISQK